MAGLGPRHRIVALCYLVIALLITIIAAVSPPRVVRAQDAAVEAIAADVQIAASALPSGLSQVLRVAPADALAPTEPAAEPRGFRGLWRSGDAIARGTLLTLAVMCTAAGYLLLRKLGQMRLIERHARTVEQSFWTAPNLYEAVCMLERQSVFRAVAEQGLEAATHREGRLTDRIALTEWIAMSLHRSVDNVNARLQHGLALLDAIGTTAPLIGLFGTVWTIHLALIETSGPSVSASVGVALLVTVVGLAVAVLAMAGSSWLARRNKIALAAVREFAEHLQAILLSADSITVPQYRPGLHERPSRALDRVR